MPEDLDVHDNTDKPQDGGTVLVDQEVFSGEGECKSGDGSSSENDPLALDDTAVSFGGVGDSPQERQPPLHEGSFSLDLQPNTTSDNSYDSPHTTLVHSLAGGNDKRVLNSEGGGECKCAGIRGSGRGSV